MLYKLYRPIKVNSACTKIQALLKFFEFNVEFETISDTEQKSEAFQKNNPFGKVPFLETPEGCIFQSHSIMRYFARKANKMYGSTVAETASIDQWLEFINSELHSSLDIVHCAILGYFSVTKQKYGSALNQLWEALEIVDRYLKNNTFLGAKQLSISDVSLYTVLRCLFRLILDDKKRKALTHLTKWFENVSNLKQFLDHFSKLQFRQELIPGLVAAKTNEAKAAEPQVKTEKPIKQKKVAKKQQHKKKQNEKKGLKVVEQEDNYFRSKTNPLDLLPKSSFDLQAFKRQICNTENKLAVIKRLWNTFDYEGWSLWKVHYIKYEGEGVIGYMTSSIRCGHVRRIDHFRKYTFATYGVYGVEGDYELQGVWMWRGLEIPEEWQEHQCYQYFVFTKMNPKIEADQALAQAYWLNTTEGQIVEGRPVYDTSWFK